MVGVVLGVVFTIRTLCAGAEGLETGAVMGTGAAVGVGWGKIVVVATRNKSVIPTPANTRAVMKKAKLSFCFMGVIS